MTDTLIAWGTNDFNTSAQLVLAKRLGLFTKEGLEVQCKLFPSEAKLLKTFERTPRKPFVWTQTGPDILLLRSQGVPLKIIAPLADISGSYQVIVRPEAGIVLPASLEDRQIALVKGSLVEVAFRHMARDFGLDVDKVHCIDAQPVRQLELFVDQEVDAIACWEPWSSQARYMGGQLYFSGLYSHIPGHEGPVNWLTGQSMLVTLEETIQTQPELLICLLQAIKKATEYLNTTLQKAATVLSELLNVERHELAQLLQNNQYSMTMDDHFRIGLVSIRNMFAALASSSRPIPSITDLYVSHLLKQIDPLLVRLGSHLIQQGATEPAEESGIITDGNIYYPVNARIQDNPDEPLSYLIVDDTQVIVDLFSGVVELMEGTVAGTASTGSEGLIQYFDLLPDIVVMDISMPDMNGLDAIKSIRGINPEANVLVVTGNNYEETRIQVFDLGAKMFIAKPFHVQDVVRVLKQLLV